MIKLLFKFGIVIFIVNTFLLSIGGTIDIGNAIFFTIMAFYAIIFLINPQQIKNIFFHKAFAFLLIINILNFIYFLLFHSFDDIKAIEYLFARAVQFSIISSSIVFNFTYYQKSFLNHLYSFVLFIVFIGFIFNPDVFSGRYSGLIWNPNMLSSFTTVAFGILLIKEGNRTPLEIFFLFVLLSVSLSTGSRGALIAIGLAFLFKYGFSNRNIIYSFLALIFGFLLINFQLETSVNRFASQDLFNDRLLQYKYSYETFLLKPLFGFGLDKYVYIKPDIIPGFLRNRIIGAHNAYLAILTQYGLVFGLPVIFIIFKKTYELLRYFSGFNSIERTYLFIVIYALFASIYETLITGINEFHTILFWFSLAFLSYAKFKHQHDS